MNLRSLLRSLKKSPLIRTTEPIVGLRLWKLTDDCRLQSVVFQQHVWPLRKPLVQDIINDAGIYAVKDGTTLSRLMMDYDFDVAGEVYLWGRVKEHELGYLAQYAYPKRLFVSESIDPTKVLELEYNYGVPCEFHAGVIATLQMKAANREAIWYFSHLHSGAWAAQAQGINRRMGHGNIPAAPRAIGQIISGFIRST